MAEILISWANAGFTQTVAAAALIALCNWLMRRWRNASARAKTELRQQTLRALSNVVAIAQYLVVLAWMWSGLAPLLEPDTPPSRKEVAAIAMWMSLGVVSFVMLVMAYFDEKAERLPAARQSESCSTEPESR